MYTTFLRIADLPIHLRVHGLFDKERFRYRFGLYEVPKEGKSFSLNLWVERHGKLLEPADVPYPGVKAYVTPDGIKLLREGLSMWIDTSLSANVFARGPEKWLPLPFSEEAGPADTPLRIFSTYLLLEQKKGIFFHACGYASPLGGILFLGVSGAGKTTLARLLPKEDVLSDDQVALLHNPSWSVCATPFVGERGQVIPPRKVPLRAIVVLNQPRIGTVQRIANAQCIPMLLRCMPLYSRCPEHAAFALFTAQEIALSIPILTGSPNLQEGIIPWLTRIDRLLEPGVPHLLSSQPC